MDLRKKQLKNICLFNPFFRSKKGTQKKRREPYLPRASPEFNRRSKRQREQSICRQKSDSGGGSE